jgi:putative MATE family efflux protein
MSAKRREFEKMEEKKENRLGTMAINPLLISMAFPIMLSMLVQALYNVVDSIFVARVSDAAFTALSLAFPAQNLMIAVSVGTAVGVNSLMSRRLGEKKFEEANLAAENGMFLALISAAVFCLFGLFGSRAFFSMFTDDEALIELGKSYLTIVCGFPFGLFFSVMGERLVQATGNSVYTMISQGMGAITNIILDPIMIFGLLGFPAMGVAGAAIATVIGQVVSMAIIFWCNYKHNHEINMKFRGFRPSGAIIGEIYRVGLPSILMQAVSSIMTFGMNKILIFFSQTAVNVFGAYFKLQSFIFMPVFGLNNGMIPIIGYNYGARHKDRIMKTFRLALCIAAGIMAVGTIVFGFFPGTLLSVCFSASDEMLTIGIPALRILGICFIPAAVTIIISGVFQAMGAGVNSMIVSFTRQLVVLLPMAYILGHLISLEAVWWSFPIAEVVALILSITMFIRLYHKQIETL